MEAKQVSSNLYKEAMDTKNDRKVMVIGWKKGWVEVEDESTNSIYKLRAKDLEAIEGAKADVKVEDVEEFDPNDKGELVDVREVTCPQCEHKFDSRKTENIVCPECKWMFTVRLHPNKDNYVVGLAATESGRDTMDINDDVAGCLRGLPIEDVFDTVTQKLCDEVGEGQWFSKSINKKWKDATKGLEEYDCYETLLSFLWKKYAHLNLGMQRMNLGNLLRGALTRQAKVDDQKS